MRNVRHMRATQRRSYLLPLMTGTSSRSAWLHSLLTDLDFSGKLERTPQRRGVWTVIWARKQASGQNTVSWPSSRLYTRRSGTTHDPCQIKYQILLNYYKSIFAFRYLLRRSAGRVFISKWTIYTAIPPKKKGGRAVYTNPCINNVMKETTCSSDWP